MKTTVCHCKRSLYDVYIGRGPDPLTGVEGKWGNPFVIGKDGTRMETIRKHKEWLLKQPRLVEVLSELKGKRLGCWCKPGKACHGDTLAELADQVDERARRFVRDGELPRGISDAKLLFKAKPVDGCDGLNSGGDLFD